MKFKKQLALMLLFAVGSTVNAQDNATEEKKQEAPPAMEYPMKPLPEHEVLKADSGVWDAEINMWMAGPTEKPSTSKGVEKITMLGNFWSISHFEYDFMGQKVQGHGLIGYDPDKKKYVGTWHESGSPYVSTMVGDYDAKKKQFVFEMLSKGMDGKDQKGRILMTRVDEKTKTFEMQNQMNGQWVKSVFMKYTKR